MHLVIFVLLTIIGTGIAYSVITEIIPAGTPRQILLIALAAGAGLLLFDRIARAEGPPPELSGRLGAVSLAGRTLTTTTVSDTTELFLRTGTAVCFARGTMGSWTAA